MGIERYYDKKYEDEKIKIKKIKLGHIPKDRYEAVLLKCGSGERVLDVGCGGGTILSNLKERFKEVYGIDLSKERIDHIKKEFNDKKFHFSVQNIEEKTNFKNDFFDSIILSDVIEHVVDLNATLKELKRIIKPKGRLVMATPNFAFITKRIDLLFGKFPPTSYPRKDQGFHKFKEHGYDGGHLHYFTFYTLKRLFELCGFKVLETYGYGRFNWLYPGLFSPGVCVVGEKKE